MASLLYGDNWCWCEPWICAVNNSLISYGGKIKPAYDHVKASLRDITPALAVDKFMFSPGEDSTPTLWLFNDSDHTVTAQITVWVDFGDGVKQYFAADTLTANPHENVAGARFCVTVPENLGKGRFTVVAQAVIAGKLTYPSVENRYVFAIEEKK